MAVRRSAYRMMVISKSAKIADYLKDALPADMCRDMVCVTNVGEAKRVLVSTWFDIVIINTPLGDDFGLQAAIDISQQNPVGVILLVKNDMYEEVSYRVEDYGIMTVPKQTTRQMLYLAVKMMAAVQVKIKGMAEETTKLKVKLKELKLVDRAKWILIDQLKMSETQAHKYIEKQAMDRCVKREEIAENIIRTYG